MVPFLKLLRALILASSIVNYGLLCEATMLHIFPLERSNQTFSAFMEREDTPFFVAPSENIFRKGGFSNLKEMRVQLEEEGPIFTFRKDAKTSRPGYFVGMTRWPSSDTQNQYPHHLARASFYRRTIPSKNVSLLTGVIHDMSLGYWYEIKPTIEGLLMVTVVPEGRQQTSASRVPQRRLLETKQSTSLLRSKAGGNKFHDSNKHFYLKFPPFVRNSWQLYKKSIHRLVPRNFFPPDTNIDDNDDDFYGEDVTIVDILVIWTHQAECIKSHLPFSCTVSTTTRQHMNLAIHFFVQETNTVLINSGLSNLKLRLAHSQRVSYQESTFENALQDLGSGGIPVVSDIRSEYHADMVMLLMDNSDDVQETGIAYKNQGHYIHADFMYSVVAIQYTSLWYLPAHELGHNFGCSHDRGTLNECDDAEHSNYGYRDPKGRFRTIMSYPYQPEQDLCEVGDLQRDEDNQRHRHQRQRQAKLDIPRNWPIIPYFSNDRATISDFEGASLGGPANDCVRQIEKVQNQIANLY